MKRWRKELKKCLKQGFGGFPLWRFAALCIEPRRVRPCSRTRTADDLVEHDGLEDKDAVEKSATAEDSRQSAQIESNAVVLLCVCPSLAVGIPAALRAGASSVFLLWHS